MRTTWNEEELKLALNIAEDPTLTWREIAEAVHGRGYPKRSPGSVSVLLRSKGAPLRETDSGEPVGNKGGGHYRRPGAAGRSPVETAAMDSVAQLVSEVRRASRAEVIRTIRAALDRLEAADG
jgi:hypothetical protein